MHKLDVKALSIINPISTEEIINNLYNQGFQVIKMPLCHEIAKPLAGHPDMQIFVHENTIIHRPRMDKTFLDAVSENRNLIAGKTKLLPEYPKDIAYNLALVGNRAFHKKDKTDPMIIDRLKSMNIHLEHVNQGYTKCSSCIVSDKALITADKGLSLAAETSGIRALIIKPGYIDLPGYKYGFIGGASGLYKDTVYFTGTLNHHPDYKRIVAFIKAEGKKIVFLSQDKCIDLGSIFFI